MTEPNSKELRRRHPIPPKDGFGFALLALILAVALWLATGWVMWLVKQTMTANGFQASWADALLVLFALLPSGLLWSALRSLGQAVIGQYI